MEVRLIHPDGDPDLPAPPFAEDLVADLGLAALFEAMAEGEELRYRAVREGVLAAANPDPRAIPYRQAVFQDVLAHPEAVAELDALARETLEQVQRSHFGFTWRTPGAVLFGALEAMEALLVGLRRLRDWALTARAGFSSPGFRALFERLEAALPDAFFQEAEDELRRLRDRRGVWAGVRLGEGLLGRDHRPLAEPPGPGGLLGRWLGGRAPVHRVVVAERDVAGARALGALSDRALAPLARVLAESAQAAIDFFQALRRQLAFYRGAAALWRRLAAAGLPRAIPQVGGEEAFSADALYDPGLVLRGVSPVVTNDLRAGGRPVLFITGANRGGKTTFLRAIGVAQLLFQAGLFVPAAAYRAGVRRGVFTHFVRPEEAERERGKFLEELARMDALVEAMRPGSLLLLNESFASTNEREATLVAEGLVRALAEAGVRVAYVTHLHRLAAGFCQAGRALCLRAERGPEGARTFRIRPGVPRATAHADDLYRRILGG